MKRITLVLIGIISCFLYGISFGMSQSLQEAATSPINQTPAITREFKEHVRALIKEKKPLSPPIVELIVHSFDPDRIRSTHFNRLVPEGLTEHPQAQQIAAGFIKRYITLLKSPIQRLSIGESRKAPSISDELFVPCTERLQARYSRNKDIVDIFSHVKNEDGSSEDLHMLRCILPPRYHYTVEKFAFSPDNDWLLVTNTEGQKIYFELPVRYLSFDLSLDQIIFVRVLHVLSKDFDFLLQCHDFGASVFQNLSIEELGLEKLGQKDADMFYHNFITMLDKIRTKRRHVLSSEKTISSDYHVPDILCGYLSKTELRYLETDLVLIPSVRIKKKICKGLIELLKIEWPEKDYSSYDCSLKKFRKAHPPQSVHFLKTAYIDKVNENIRALAQELESHPTLCQKGNMSYGNPLQEKFVTIISDAFEETRLYS